MYELEKIGKVFTSKFVGTRPSSNKKKKNLPGRGLTKVEKHCSTHCSHGCQHRGHSDQNPNWTTSKVPQIRFNLP